MLAGVGPLLVAALVGGWWHQIASALLLAPALLGMAKADRTRAGIGMVLLAYVAHCAITISLAYHLPAVATGLLPDGAEYWAKQQVWIRTGEDPEYVLANWVPAHGQLYVVVVALSYLSLGLLPLVRGFYEVDLMNFYVGRMLAEGDGSIVSLLVGWHPWSVMRGICYAFVIFELASYSLERMTGRVLSTARRRKQRWALGAFFFLADCVVKIVTLDTVRGALAVHLGEP